MIVGLGNDIVNIKRIEASLQKFGLHFMNKIFTQEEIQLLQQMPSEAKRAAGAAKIFAAKEACSKALGTGFRYGLEWKDISLSHDKHGRPLLSLSGKGLEFMHKIGGKNLWLTLSDDAPWVSAVVIIES